MFNASSLTRDVRPATRIWNVLLVIDVEIRPGLSALSVRPRTKDPSRHSEMRVRFELPALSSPGATAKFTTSKRNLVNPDGTNDLVNQEAGERTPRRVGESWRARCQCPRWGMWSTRTCRSTSDPRNQHPRIHQPTSDPSNQHPGIRNFQKQVGERPDTSLPRTSAECPLTADAIHKSGKQVGESTCTPCGENKSW